VKAVAVCPPDVDSTAPEYQLVQRDAYVHVALYGRPRLAMVVSMFAELEQLTTKDGELLVLIDESEMKAALLGPTELRAMIDVLKGSAGLRYRSRIAIYAPSNIVYGLNRMAQAFAGEASEGRLAVFRTEDAAENWLREPSHA
jgi:hypothetical protein